MPLSYAQQRLWFIDQLEGSSSQYNMPVALRLVGQLNISALEQTLNAIVERHEVLRSTYANNEQGIGQQIIHPPRPVKLQQINADNLETGPALSLRR